MRTKCLLAWFAGMFLFLILAVIVSAQDQKKTSIKEGRLSGTVHAIDKDTSSIIIRQGAVQRRVIYNTETKFIIQNKPGTIDDVIVGRQVTCLGGFNDKSQLMATRVDVRSR
jgi:hypothetical protein